MARKRTGVLTDKGRDLGPGGSVDDRLREGTRFSFGAVVDLVDAVAAALDDAQRRGRAHRPLTPRTILFDPEGHVHIAIAGVEQTRDAGARGAGSGSRLPAAIEDQAYQAPEQWRRQPADARADQYALAVIVYELLSGQRRLDAPVVDGIQTLEPIDVLADVPLRRGLGLHVNAALRRALSASAANRFPTLDAFASALAGRDPTEVPARRRPRSYRYPRWPRGRTVAITILALSGVLIVADAGVRTRLQHAWRALRLPTAWLSGIGGMVRPPGPASAPLGTGSTGSPGVSAGPTTTAGAPPALLTSAPAGRAPSIPVAAASIGSWMSRMATALGMSLRPPAPPPATGFIAVTVNSGSALVIIDGIPRGTSPYLGEATVGRHSVSVRSWGRVYRPPRTLVTVTQRDTARVTWRAPSG